jgi:hypothetical protein
LQVPEPTYPDDYPEPTGTAPNAPSPDLPYFDRLQVAPMIITPAVSVANCPHCETPFSVASSRARDGDAGVCGSCMNLVIRTPSGWRHATYDEAELWDGDVRVRVMREAMGKPPPIDD